MVKQNWSPEVVRLGDGIVALTLARAAELHRYLEQVHGIRAVSTLAPKEPVVEPPTPPVEPTEFVVMLEGFDPTRKIAVIKEVRELTGLGLKDAKDLVEAAPRAVKEGLPKAEAERCVARLRAAGAVADLR
jgi:large subunit ribosomal protein L7/L12